MTPITCKCQLKCSEKILPETQKTIFKSFWDMSDYNCQNAYLFPNIEIGEKKRPRTDSKKRTIKVFYFVFSEKGTRQRVCKKAFVQVHGIRRGRVDMIVNKKKSGIQNPVPDKRGKNGCRPSKFTDEQIENVKKHIKSIPSYQSHYSRHNNLNKSYMPMGYSIKSLFNNYKDEYCVENHLRPVSFDKYSRNFTGDFNISFKGPKSDTYMQNM